MRRSTMTLTLICGLLWGPARLLCQQPTIVQPGARLRLLAPGHGQLIGTYLRRTGDSIEIQFRSSGRVVSEPIALEGISRLEVSTGRRHPVGKGLLFGAAIGGASGALLGLLAGPCEGDECFVWPETRAGAAAYAGLGFAFVGALVGIAVGAIGHEEWAPAAVAGAGPTMTASGSGLGLAWRIAFQP